MQVGSTNSHFNVEHQSTFSFQKEKNGTYTYIFYFIETNTKQECTIQLLTGKIPAWIAT